MTIPALIKFATGAVVRIFGVSFDPLRRLTILWAALFIATLARGQDPTHPLKPTDLSSPRATLKTFLDAGDAVGAYLARDYLPSPSRTKFDHLFSLAGPVVKCLDLAEVAPTARRKAGFSAASALYETLSRIQLPRNLPWDQSWTHPDRGEDACQADQPEWCDHVSRWRDRRPGLLPWSAGI
jgi:hypothetical protein